MGCAAQLAMAGGRAKQGAGRIEVASVRRGPGRGRSGWWYGSTGAQRGPVESGSRSWECVCVQACGKGREKWPQKLAMTTGFI